jgi:hypothetical protein
MAPALATALLAALACHVAAGAIFAAALHWRGVGRLDAAAEHGTLGFRILVTPGIVALWPLLARRWWAASQEEPRP